MQIYRWPWIIRYRCNSVNFPFLLARCDNTSRVFVNTLQCPGSSSGDTHPVPYQSNPTVQPTDPRARLQYFWSQTDLDQSFYKGSRCPLYQPLLYAIEYQYFDQIIQEASDRDKCSGAVLHVGKVEAMLKSTTKSTMDRSIASHLRAFIDNFPTSRWGLGI